MNQQVLHGNQGLAAFSIAFSAPGVPMLTVCFGISFEMAVFDLACAAVAVPDCE